MKLHLIICLLFFFSCSYGQHINNSGCGLGTKECLQLKKRLFHNRATVSTQAIQQIRSLNGIWLPINFHVIGDSLGNYYTPEKSLESALCELNENFFDQNIQFYIDSILYFNHNLLDDNPFDSIAQITAGNLKIPNSINIFVSRNQKFLTDYGANFSFYSLSHDFLFFDQQLLNSYNISTHEMGHFFSLLHTFLGWEYEQVVNYIGTPAPDSLYIQDFGGIYIEVENEARTGANANCATAADGFCDTEADYVNVADICPMNYDFRDPLNVAIDPDEGNVMSYYLCKSYFSTEQKAAITADIVNRGWSTNIQNPTMIDTSGLQAIQPLNGQTIAINPPTQVLEWAGITGATNYQIVAYHSFPLPGTIILDTTFSTNNNFFSFDASLLLPNKHYYWKIRGTNKFDRCVGFSPLFDFYTSTISGFQPLKETGIEFKAFPINNAIECKIISSQFSSGQLHLYNMIGQELTNISIEIEPGEQIIHLPIQNQAAGAYIISLQSSEGMRQSQKVIINR